MWALVVGRPGDKFRASALVFLSGTVRTDCSSAAGEFAVKTETFFAPKDFGVQSAGIHGVRESLNWRLITRVKETSQVVSASSSDVHFERMHRTGDKMSLHLLCLENFHYLVPRGQDFCSGWLVSLVYCKFRRASSYLLNFLGVKPRSIECRLDAKGLKFLFSMRT
ncbi:hypothetical protein F4819DRAFT_84992 [Hypoxylon fuscum]|nr:hypothetical protein F4819DRAFT_84992 [Hypoxylon fuscum]